MRLVFPLGSSLAPSEKDFEGLRDRSSADRALPRGCHDARGTCLARTRVPARNHCMALSSMITFSAVACFDNPPPESSKTPHHADCLAALPRVGSVITAGDPPGFGPAGGTKGPSSTSNGLGPSGSAACAIPAFSPKS